MKKFFLPLLFTFSIFSCDSDTVEIPEDYDFTQSELSQIADLIERIPASVATGFEAKYLEWIMTWNRPEIAVQSNPYTYANSDEYEDLLKYCEPYGKAIWPLLMDKLTKESVFIISLLADLTYNGEKQGLTNDIIERNNIATKPYPSSYSLLVYHCKNLLAIEHNNILKSIQSIPAP